MTKTAIDEDERATAYVDFLLTVSSILMHMQQQVRKLITHLFSLAHFCTCSSCCCILYLRFLDLALILFLDLDLELLLDLLMKLVLVLHSHLLCK